MVFYHGNKELMDGWPANLSFVPLDYAGAFAAQWMFLRRNAIVLILNLLTNPHKIRSSFMEIKWSSSNQ